MTSASAFLPELKARIGLTSGSPTLLLLVVEDEQDLRATEQSVAELLRASALRAHELTVSGDPGSPAGWVRATRESAADAYVARIAPLGKLSARATGRLLNAQREDLRNLAGPLLLFLSRSDEQALREVAPDFFTWVAQSYEVPTLKALGSLAVASGVAKFDAAKAPEPMESPIRFLHFSDLHLRPGPTKAYDQDRVLRGLLERLRLDRESAQLDLVFVTGDIANSGSQAEYEVACKFLEKVLEVTGVPRAHLFVVPGNHDVDRNVSRWLLRTLDSDETSTKFFVEPDSRTWHEKKFDAYRARLSQLVGEERPIGLKTGADAVEVIEIRGERIAVASFNSAWFASDDADLEKLWLGEASVALAGEHIQSLGGAPLRIALMHHPTSYLSEIERSRVEHHLERSFDVVLRGHLHKDRTRIIQSQRGGYLEIAAAAAYQGSQWPNGCFFGELRLANRAVALRPYTFGSGTDPWVLDTKVFPDDEQDNYCHTFSLKERKGDPLGLKQVIAAEAPAIFHSLDKPARTELVLQMGVSGKSSRETEDRTIEAIQGSADAADFWASLDRTGQLKLRGPLGDRMAKRIAEGLSAMGERIPRSDPSFLAKALEGFAAYWKEHGHTWVHELGANEATYALAMHAFLLSSVEGPINTGAPIGKIRVDFFIGVSEDLPDQKAIIEMKRGADGLSGRSSLNQLDSYMAAAEAAQGALVMFETRKPPPEIEHAKTPGGRDVLLLRL